MRGRAGDVTADNERALRTLRNLLLAQSALLATAGVAVLRAGARVPTLVVMLAAVAGAPCTLWQGRRVACMERDVEAQLTDVKAAWAPQRAHATTAASVDVRRCAVHVRETIASRDWGVVYQPIVDLRDGRTVGLEALARFPTGSPEQWFDEAFSVGLGERLEAAAVRRALEGAADAPGDFYVSVNASPDTLTHAEFLWSMLDGPFPSTRIVLELTERSIVTDYSDLAKGVEKLRQHGVRLAVDDAGAGYASFGHILRLRPEVIKLDRSLVADLTDDRARRALVAAFVSFAHDLGADLVAEGVEEERDAETLRALGVRHVQGYLFARPGPLQRVLEGGVRFASPLRQSPLAAPHWMA